MPEATSAVPAAAHIGACLAEAAQEVLETMFFLTIEGAADWAEAGRRLHRHCCVDFHGPLEGRLDLAVSGDLAPALASGFTGRGEDELTSGDIDGVLCEMANMLCGSVLSRAEPDALFSLSAPRVTSGEAEAPGVCRVFDLGLGDVRVCVSLHTPGPKAAE